MAYIQVPKESYLEKNLVDNIYLKKKTNILHGSVQGKQMNM